MALHDFKTIKVKKYLDIVEEKAAAAATIYPGCLIYLTSADTVAVHAVAGGDVLPMFALEDELQGGGVDTNYATGAKVQCWTPTRGDVVYAILADSQTIAKGDFLESAGTGYLQKHTPDYELSDPGVSTTPNYTNQIVGVALDTLSTLAGSTDSDVDFLSIYRRIKVKIL